MLVSRVSMSCAKELLLACKAASEFNLASKAGTRGMSGSNLDSVGRTVSSFCIVSIGSVTVCGDDDDDDASPLTPLRSSPIC